MTIAQLAKLWTVLSVFVLYYAVNSWLVSQGGEPILNANLIVEDRVPAAVTGIFICASVLTLTALIGWLYAVRVNKGEGMLDGSKWAGRVPIIFFDALDFNDRVGQAYQAIMLALMIVVPVISLGHFWDRMLGATIFTTGPNSRPVGVWDFGVTFAQWNDPARICSAVGDKNTCVGGATFLPGVEPLFLGLLTILALFVLIRQLVAIFRS